ncbi:MAG: hypothetical protein ABI172_10190 [Ginsengibacter sp.]
MNNRNLLNPVNIISSCWKVFVSKLTQNPEYYNIRFYAKNKGRHRNKNLMW